MSMGFNQATIVGRITHDLDLKKAKDTYWVRFTLAVNSFGEEEAEFIDVVAFDKLAENLVEYQGKGSKVLVNGRIKISKYPHKDHEEIMMRSLDVVANNIVYLESAQKQAVAESEDENVPFHP